MSEKLNQGEMHGNVAHLIARFFGLSKITSAKKIRSGLHVTNAGMD